MGIKESNNYQHRGVGKDILRVIISFALENNFNKVTTSIFSKTGTGFFLSQGFHSTSPANDFKVEPITPEWDRARGIFPDEEIERYRALFDSESTQSTLELARSPIGKTVVYNCGCCGCIKLTDEKQLGVVNKILFGTNDSPLQATQHTAHDFFGDGAAYG